MLVFTVLAATDPRNSPHPIVIPIALFLVLFGIGIAFGAQTGFAVNPARDFGPRILTAMAGYGREVFNFRRQYWLWAGILAPILGGLVATFVYDTLLFTGDTSIINRRSATLKNNQAVNEKPNASNNSTNTPPSANIV